MRLHLQLEHIVLLDFVASEVWEGRFFNNDTSGHVLENMVISNKCRRIFLGEDATGVVVNDEVVLDDSFGIDHYYSEVVIVDRILFNQQLVLALHHKDTLTLTVFYQVVLDFCFARVFSADRDVRFDVGIDLVADDFSVAALDDEDALVVIVPDDVGVRETFDFESTVDVVLQILHGHLVSEVFVVKLG